jgi:alpha-L-fucosidase
MKSFKVALWLAVFTCAGWLGAAAVPAPAPYGPAPTPRQLAWHGMEFYGFVHFTVNTFTDKEWGYGDEDPAVFNPTDFDADQIARTAKQAGMAGLILTAKHHDGFCLWPSRYTEHSVKHSPWRSGKGDVVKELSQACRRQGIKFGVYLSPWDRNHKEYGRPAYIEYYRNQLRELLTQYGPVFTVWFDGANGGDGYYGGAREMRKIDNRTYYDWKHTWQIVRDLMPNAVMFSDVGPDFRWVGNENGFAGEPCWATLNVGDDVPGNTKANLNQGERPGTSWVPPECDVSIRPGWFYHASEDAKVKTPAQLLDIYYKSVGRGAGLNLNLPPDRRGRIHENDVQSLREFRGILDRTFAKNLARNARITANNYRGASASYSPRKLLDGRRASYWATDDGVKTAEVVMELKRRTELNVVELREYLPLGQRIEAFALDRWTDQGWQEFARGTSIGNRRLLRFPNFTTDKVRLRITQAAAGPALAEFGLYLEPAELAPTKR